MSVTPVETTWVAVYGAGHVCTPAWKMHGLVATDAPRDAGVATQTWLEPHSATTPASGAAHTVADVV